jgi:hypothetical protein
MGMRGGEAWLCVRHPYRQCQRRRRPPWTLPSLPREWRRPRKLWPGLYVDHPPLSAYITDAAGFPLQHTQVGQQLLASLPRMLVEVESVILDIAQRRCPRSHDHLVPMERAGMPPGAQRMSSTWVIRWISRTQASGAGMTCLLDRAGRARLTCAAVSLLRQSYALAAEPFRDHTMTGRENPSV